MPKFTEHDIRTLAYKFWQERGCPFDSLSEEDWIKAEQILMTESYPNVDPSVPSKEEDDDTPAH